MKQEFPILDLLIVGAGPIGLNCALVAQKAGLNTLIIEKGVLVNSLYHFPTNMTFFSTSKLLEIGEVPFISHSEKPTRREALEYYRRVQQSLNLKARFFEPVEAVQKRGDIFEVRTSKGHYLAHNVIVATGFYDNYRPLGVKGEDLPKVKHFYDEPHPYIGQKVLIIGAANSACDVALETYHKGAEVTMAVRKPSISERVKYWIRPNIINRIKEGSIRAFFETTVGEIRPSEVLLHTPDGPQWIENDFVLAMTGYLPDYPFLESLGIQFSTDAHRTPVFNEQTLETNIEGLYIAGVINAGMQTSKLFIENTRIHAKLIVGHLLEKQAAITKPVHPS